MVKSPQGELQASSSSRSLPVTLLSGFLGSGKTSLMKHILQNKEGLRVAVTMNEITEVNLDVLALEGAKLLKSEEKLVEMANGCICCTLREDLLLQLRELARSDKFDAVLIESSGIAEPMQVAETFFVNLKDGNGQLQDEAPLDNCVTVVDASMLSQYMTSLQTVDTLDPEARGSDEGQQDIAELLFAQLEFANVVLLNKVDLLGNSCEERKEIAESLATIVKKINKHAKVINTEHSRVPLDEVLNTHNFSREFAEGVYKWMDDIQSGVKHVPETLEYGVSGFYWTADLPFHPKRLHDWFMQYFALKDVPMDDEQEPAESAAGSAKQPVARKTAAPERKLMADRYGNLFRSKGFVWLGGQKRQGFIAHWQQAGPILTFQAARPLDVREQKLTFVGQHLKHDVLKADLCQLLMTPAEMEQVASDEEAGKTDTLEDPFEPFPPTFQELLEQFYEREAAKEAEDAAEFGLGTCPMPIEAIGEEVSRTADAAAFGIASPPMPI